MIKFKIPLLKDHHHHPSIYTTLIRSCIVAAPMKTKNELLKSIEEKKDEIIVVGGWDCTKFDLKKLDINNYSDPIIICNRSFHRYIINDSFKEKLVDDYPNIINNIENQNWTEHNIFNIMKFLVNIKPFELDHMKTHFNNMLRSFGIFFAEEMLLPDEPTLEKYIELDLIDKRTEIWVELDKFTKMNQKYRDKIKGIKIFLDGAFGSYAASMKDPYLTGRYGFLNHSNEKLVDILETVAEFDKQISFHNVGDRATEQIIDILWDINKDNCKKPKHIRLEHTIFINKKYAEKAKDLGIILCMQPNFSYDTIRFKDRVTEKYLKKINPFRMLIDDIGFVPGEDLIFGSDGMPQGVVDGLQQSLFPPLKHQKITIEEFKKSYCLSGEKFGYINVEIDRKRHIKVNVHYSKNSIL